MVHLSQRDKPCPLGLIAETQYLGGILDLHLDKFLDHWDFEILF